MLQVTKRLLIGGVILLVTEVYKELHKIPELSEKEYETSKYIFNTLKDFGYSPVYVGNTGVCADLVCDEDLPWIILRADIDALPICESSGVSYASQNDGVMHACGHDAHSAMLLETAKQLLGKKLPNNIRFVFQPAEEPTTGAIKIINDVIPQNLIACFAMHVWPQVPFGTAVTKSGALMASSDFAKIRFYGKAAHCSQQEKGNNALLSAVDMVSAFKGIKDSIADDNALLFCGSIHSGIVHNIVPDFSEIFATIRTYSETQRNNIKEQLLKTANTIANNYGTKATLDFEGGCPPVYNDENIVNILADAFGIKDNADTTLAGEDFSYFGQHAPSCMIWLGIGDTPPLHNEKFFVPLDVLPIGVDLWTKIAAYNWEDEKL